MERWRAPLASIAPIPPGPVCTAEKRWRAGGRAATETATGFKKKIRLAWPRCTPIKEQANRNWLGKESITAWTLRTPRSPENRASRANLPRAIFCSYRLLFGKPVQGPIRRPRDDVAKTPGDLSGHPAHAMSSNDRFYLPVSAAARNRSSDSTSAGSATVSAISWRKSSRYLLRSL
jgi:hypothetical protein